MGGEILEFSADKYYNAGEAMGFEKGRAEGEAIGEARGRAEILSALVKDGFLSASEAARRMNMTESEFLKLSGQYIAH